MHRLLSSLRTCKVPFQSHLPFCSYDFWRNMHILAYLDFYKFYFLHVYNFHYFETFELPELYKPKKNIIRTFGLESERARKREK